MMSRTCTAVAWCAVAALLVSAATAARLDLWPTSSGPLNEGNHSRTHVASLERIGWDRPSYGRIRVASGDATGHYLTGENDYRDWYSLYLHAERDSKLSAVFDFEYRMDLDAYLIMCVSFEFGPGTNDEWGAGRYIAEHEATEPSDTLPNDELRVMMHENLGDFSHWRLSEHADGGFLMQLMKEEGQDGRPEAGRYLSIPEDVDERDRHSRFVSVTDDESKATRVEVQLP